MKAQKGFSLVELLVVIAVISLLVSLLLPSLSEMRDMAKTQVGRSNLRNIGQAIYMYVNEYDGMLPVGYVGGSNETDWSVLIQPLLGSAGDTYATLGPQRNPMLRDPNAALPGGDLHYSSNPVLIPNISDTFPPMTTYDTSRLKRASEILLVADGVQDPALNGRSAATAYLLDAMSLLIITTYFDAGDADNNTPIYPGLNIDDSTNAATIRWRQRGDTSANMLFADGHAATQQPQQVMKRNIRPDA